MKLTIAALVAICGALLSASAPHTAAAPSAPAPTAAPVPLAVEVTQPPAATQVAEEPTPAPTPSIVKPKEATPAPTPAPTPDPTLAPTSTPDPGISTTDELHCPAESVVQQSLQADDGVTIATYPMCERPDAGVLVWVCTHYLPDGTWKNEALPETGPDSLDCGADGKGIPGKASPDVL